jgi:hypothetical protein
VEIASLEWRRPNVAKLREHGIAPWEVDEVKALGTWVAYVHPGYPEQVRVVGPTIAGRFLTIVCDETEDEGVWRPKRDGRRRPSSWRTIVRGPEMTTSETKRRARDKARAADARPWQTPEDTAGWSVRAKGDGHAEAPPSIRVVLDLSPEQSAWLRDEARRTGLDYVALVEQLLEQAMTRNRQAP